MKIDYFPSASRGKADYDWLKTNYSFSFAQYYNPNRMGFGSLRVLNDDWIAPASGFPPHSHQDMEIITIPLTGTLSHQDSTGSEGKIQAGDVQIMSAGTGVTHSEDNHDPEIPVELFQIWITPHTRNVDPQYDQRSFEFRTIHNSIFPFVTPDGSDRSLSIHQHAWLSWSHSDGYPLTYALHGKQQGVFALVIEGSGTIADQEVGPRDAVEIHDTTQFTMIGTGELKVLCIEVPV